MVPHAKENGPAAARSMLVKRPAPYTPDWFTFPKALCEIPQQHQCADCPVEVLEDLILEDNEDDEIPRDVVRCISIVWKRNVFFWGLWDIKRVSFLTAIVNQT
ncbi:hypothetical protein P7K49_014028 [Saguinus oedipus]|uniref:Uncharacterized protein n=1 Tax=Saguinus oedipus TaxID=9490 RepID=A0ABQ9VJW2_SAGOE|nr:hypothetical protein P7K49_014028 [Saguinus oedipus]